MLLLLLASACEPFGPFSTLPPDGGSQQDALVVSPAEIDFDVISVIREGFSTESFTITNGGTETIAVHGQDEVLGDDEAFEVASDPLLELQPGNSQEILVTFRPTTEATYRGELRFNYGTETLDLVGRAIAPVLVVDTPDVPDTAVGCSSDLVIPVRNAGSETLVLSGVEAEDDTEFVVTLPDDTTLGPGESARIDLSFAPVGDGVRTTTVRILSNDPADPDISPASIVLEGLGTEASTASEAFIYAPGLDADVLFVVDTDGVMGAIVDLAEPAMKTFLEQMDVGNVNLHATVLTGDSTCPTVEPGWISGDETDSTRLKVLQESLSGDAGEWSDRLLALASTALANETGSGDCLDGFLRSGAQLHVIVISGGPDQSGLTTTQSLNMLRSAAPTSPNAVVSAIIVTDSIGCRGATYGDGYAQVAVATGGEIGDLCASDWSDDFARLADVSVLAANGALAHPLEQLPLEDSIAVRVDGATWTRWTYDDENNSVVFSGNTLPDTGSAVEITYTLAESCW